MIDWLQRAIAMLMMTGIVAGCTTSNDAVMQANKDLVQQFVEAINARDFDHVRALVTPNVTRHCQATPDVTVTNADELITFLQNDVEVFPDSRITLRQLVAEDSLVAFWANYVGTQEGPMGPFPPSHKRMDIEFAGYFRIEVDRLAELWVTWDNVAGLAQLGHFPPPQPDSL